MPSFLKKLLYGKELSNPYVNPYHPGHTSRPPRSLSEPSSGQYPTYPQPPEHFPSPLDTQPTNLNAHPTNLTLSTRLQPHPVTPLESRDYLGEARQLVGRDPATGRLMPAQQFVSYWARSGESTSTTGHGNLQPEVQWEPNRWYTGKTSENPYVNGGDASMGRPIRKGEVGRINHAGIVVQKESEQSRGAEERNMEGPNGMIYDIVLPQERRKKEEEEARARMPTQMQEFFAPTRPVVREFYGGA